MNSLTAYVYCQVEGCRARMACNWRHLDNLRTTYLCADHKKGADRATS